MAEQSKQHIQLAQHISKQTTDDSSLDFTAIYTTHRLSIYRYILARVGHVEDAQDLTAQVFLKAYRKQTHYRQEAPIIAWLMGITRHQLIDYYRGQRNTISLSDLPDIANNDSSLEEDVDQRARMKRVAEALNAISEDRREAIAMRLFAGLGNQEIADIMNKSPQAIAMLVHRGIQDLKQRLGEENLS